MLRLATTTVLLALLAPALPTAAAQAEPAPSEGRAFAPRPMGPELYDIQAPTPTNGQTATLQAADGTDLFIEWWLPKTKDPDGPQPPARLPVIGMLNPYATGQGDPREADTLRTVVTRGYAYASFHIRGTGLSGGCQEQFSSNEVDDAARAIEFMGTAPFSDGNVGTTGLSYPGITQVAAAGRGDREKVKYLKAIVAGGVASSQYDYNFFDGVPFTAQAPAHAAAYNGLTSFPSPGTRTYPAERASCLPAVTLGSADQTGDFTPFWADRDHRQGVPATTAATLVYHGHRDEIDREIALAGWFDRLPATTPKHLVLGTFAHAYPDDTRGQTPWGREDWEAMKLEWFDRHVKGDRTATTDQWPVAEVQDQTGQWRAEPDWPNAAGPEGRLALTANKTLGATRPTGQSSFLEGAWTEGPASKAGRGLEQGRLVFETPALTDTLHVTGQPTLDAWVQLDRPAANIAARLETIDANGARTPYGETMGFHSMTHNDPLVDGRFVQAQTKPAPVLTPVRMRLRFDPASLVVPAGGRLRLTLAGSLAPNTLTPSQPSGLGTQVSILHDCAHPTVLRFQTLDPRPDLLNVEEIDEDLPLTSAPRTEKASDGGGLAAQQVCGG